MKRLLACIMTLALILAPLPACSNSQNQAKEDKLRIVCAFFAPYDWTKEIVGDMTDELELSLLLDSGVDIHSFQPTVEDIALISTCDLFIYLGGESDEWIQGVLQTATNEDMININMMDVLGNSVKVEEIKEGMAHNEELTLSGYEGGLSNYGTEIESDEHKNNLDEHIWLSLRNAEILSQQIANVLSELDTKNARTYQANVAAYIEQLTLLDHSYQDVTENATYDTLLFGDRFPFRYLVDDYGLDYYAAFPGCSSETAASFETVIELAKLLDELNLKAVMVTESSDEALAKTIIDNTKTKDHYILTLDAMQSITADDINSGTTYLSLASSNLETLKEALN